MKDVSFENRLEKSKEILQKLMNPDITLKQSVSLYKEGMNELEVASKLLEEAKLEFLEYQNRNNEKDTL